ncbi:hypothetical protein DQ04_00071110 [Trypanosoma grayi]|uniref:hypothetical protein n=1 Tax=Trypanosoma grayi TaxID=71804 RepID=UPI0004F417A1|nr:hypothetical protein DQ04_00071110 [Trypanosoma grayi]KEG15443.1 hypothetical protein DQ04_00071110 [Trypanosoma grayi]
MVGNSSEAVGEGGGEVGRLQDELSKAHERLRLWKDKTQSGVDQLRNRIVELSRELDESRSTNAQLEEKLRGITEAPSTSVAPLAVPGVLICAMTEWANSSMNMIAATSIGKLEGALDLAAAVSQELDKYKRRTAQTLRLQTRNLEALQLEISGLRQELNAALDEVRERNCAVESRDQAIAVLQNRVEDLEAANARLESSRVMMSSKPNAEQINVLEARVEEEVESLRHEFISREAAIFDQHRDELERLITAHEQEVAELRAELEERPLAAAPMVETDGQPAGGVSDAAYAELVSDFEALQDELRVTRTENQRLLRELHDLRERPPHGDSTATGGSGGINMDNNNNNNNHRGSGTANTTLRRGPQTWPEALVHIAELESGMKRLSDELCEAKKRLIESKHQANTKEGGCSQALEGQQLSYLKFVVVKLLCGNDDAQVAMNLFPVLSTLLHFDPTDLQDIYAANPGWMKRRAL